MITRSRLFPTAAILLVAAALAATLILLRPETRARGNLEGSAIGGEFQLVDEMGKPTRWSDFAGKWRLIYFGYTFCPDVCPVDTANMAAGLAAFEKAEPARGAQVQPIFVTVDPARDTPAVLAEFTDNFHPRLIGLTGSEATIADTLKAFRVYARRINGASKESYLIDHMAVVYLFDPDGRPIAFLAGPDAKPQAVTSMLEAHVR
ncbi:SCO family protein [Thermaurantiacus sp.]